MIFPVHWRAAFSKAAECCVKRRVLEDPLFDHFDGLTSLSLIGCSAPWDAQLKFSKEGFAHLTGLKSLNLKMTSLRPVSLEKALRRMSSLTDLSITFTYDDFTILNDTFSNASSLLYLTLTHHDGTFTEEALAPLTALTSLNVSSCQ